MKWFKYNNHLASPFTLASSPGNKQIRTEQILTWTAQKDYSFNSDRYTQIPPV